MLEIFLNRVLRRLLFERTETSSSRSEIYRSSWLFLTDRSVLLIEGLAVLRRQLPSYLLGEKEKVKDIPKDCCQFRFVLYMKNANTTAYNTDEFKNLFLAGSLFKSELTCLLSLTNHLIVSIRNMQNPIASIFRSSLRFTRASDTRRYFFVHEIRESKVEFFFAQHRNLEISALERTHKVPLLDICFYRMDVREVH